MMTLKKVVLALTNKEERILMQYFDYVKFANQTSS